MQKPDETAALPGRILEALQLRIVSGQYQPGTWLPPERELSAEFNADRSVVRNALIRLEVAGMITRARGHRPRVRSQTAGDDVEEKPMAKAMTSRSIAAALPQHQMDPASRAIFQGFKDTLQAQPVKYRLVVLDFFSQDPQNEDPMQEASAAVESEQIAGALVWPSLEQDVIARWNRLARQGRAIVFVDCYDAAVPSDFVGIDNYVAAREATEYLLEHGHTRIAHVTNDEPLSAVLERAAGYQDALRAAGVGGALTTPWVMPFRERDRWLEDFVTYCIEAAEPPTAIFAVNDHLAYKLITLLEKSGIQVPQQISIIGFDDIDRYSPRPPLLTTVRQPFERIGQRAALLLLQRLAHKGPPPQTFQHIIVPTSLIERGTCRALKEFRGRP